VTRGERERGTRGPVVFGGSVDPRFWRNIPNPWAVPSLSKTTKHIYIRDHPVPSMLWLASKHTLKHQTELNSGELMQWGADVVFDLFHGGSSNAQTFIARGRDGFVLWYVRKQIKA
jgi:hypothetical protein